MTEKRTIEPWGIFTMIDKTEDEVPSKEEKKRGSETQEENQGSSGRGRGHSAGRHRHRRLVAAWGCQESRPVHPRNTMKRNSGANGG